MTKIVSYDAKNAKKLVSQMQPRQTYPLFASDD